MLDGSGSKYIKYLHCSLKLTLNWNIYRYEIERSVLNLTLACAAAPFWYLRRTSWRITPPMMGLPRQVATGLRASLQLSNRPIFVFKVPAIVRSQDTIREFWKIIQWIRKSIRVMFTGIIVKFCFLSDFTVIFTDNISIKPNCVHLIPTSFFLL